MNFKIKYLFAAIGILSLLSCGTTQPDGPVKNFYHVTFDADGGDPTPSEQEVEENGTVTIPEDPKKERARFDYWQERGKSTPYDFQTPVTHNLDFVAAYTNFYQVTFETFGGSVIPSQLVLENGYAKKPQDPIKPNVDFENWYYASDMGGLQTFNFDSMPIVKNIVLYAKFKNEYVITFETNGGTPLQPVVVIEGEKVPKPANPEKYSADFDGWYTDKEFKNIYNFDNVVKQSMTLYAKWTTIWEVILYAPGASPQRQIKNVRDKEYVVDYVLPEMDGYDFKGWHFSQIFPVDEEPINLNNMPIEGDTFLFASWDKDIPKKTVTFKYEDGVTPDLVKGVEIGSYVEQPADPIRTDFYFDDWYQKIGNDEYKIFDFNEPITEDVELYARYVDKGIRVTLDSSDSLQFKYPTTEGDCFTVQVVLASDVDSNYYYVPKSLSYYDITCSNGRNYLSCSFDSSKKPYTLTIDLSNQTSVVHVKAPKAICKYMSFKATADDSWVSFNPDLLHRGGGKLQYNDNLSSDGWTDWEGGHDDGKLRIAKGKTYYVRGTNDKLGGTDNNFLFDMNGEIEADGDVTSLRNFSTSESSYRGLFNSATALLKAPQLPLESVCDDGYAYMFQGCSSLVEPPVLPATSLGKTAYYAMFEKCSALKNAPLLRAKTLKQSCYKSMFSGCRSLVKAPPLTAEVLADSCYDSMFSSCTSLVQMPDIGARKTSLMSCQSMFSDCKSLRFTNELGATELADSCYSLMFFNCTSLIKAPKLPSSHLISRCYQFMFNGCATLRDIEVGFDESGFDVDHSTYEWFKGVTAIGSFTWKGSEIFENRGVSTIPNGWYVRHSD